MAKTKDESKKPKHQTKCKHQGFARAMRIVGVTAAMQTEYEKVLAKEDVDHIVSLIDSPNRFIEIRDALYSRLDTVTKAAAEPEDTEG